jgi:Ca-activated chloride channel family protein
MSQAQINSTRLKASTLLMISVALLLALASGLALPPLEDAQASALKDRSTQDQDDDVVRVNTDLVVLNATVLDKEGKFVPGLKRTDFRIFEDGEEQKLASFTAEETPFAAAILLDTSGSMETRLTLGRSAAIKFLEGLRDEDVAAVYNFDMKVEQMQDFSPGRDLPPRAFGLRTKMMTALNDAVLRAADDLAKREEKRRAIVVLSDGGENYSRASSDKALDHALQAFEGMKVHRVGRAGAGRRASHAFA